MSTWWDDDAKRYQSTFVYKVFYVWGWPVARWVMYNCMSSERAHTFALHWAIPIIGRIDRVWTFMVTVLAFVVLLLLMLVIRLLILLPWFTFEAPRDHATQEPQEEKHDG